VIERCTLSFGVRASGILVTSCITRISWIAFCARNSYCDPFSYSAVACFVYADCFSRRGAATCAVSRRTRLTPGDPFLAAIQSQLGSRAPGQCEWPSLFWLGISDQGLSIFSWIGFCLSLVVLAGYANAFIHPRRFVDHLHSIVHIGQIWYGYGWGDSAPGNRFPLDFSFPLLDGRPFPNCRPPLLILWLFRWLGFGLWSGGPDQTRGDPCWHDLTCLYYHYETQPLPNPISRYLHFAPNWFHKFETAWNHFIS